VSAFDPKELKKQIRAMAAGRNDGLHLDTPFQWMIEGLKQPVPFFEHLPKLLPPDSVLYVEGGEIVPESATFYSAHRAPHPVAVVRDTVFPMPEIFHVTFSPDVSIGLRRLAERRSVAEMFDHLKAYRDGKLLMTFHDAFDGVLCVSEHVPEKTVAQFCRALEVDYRREKTAQRDPEEFRKVLWALENHPERLKHLARHEPWFRRAWRWLSRK
jgi:hypothetical protein